MNILTLSVGILVFKDKQVLLVRHEEKASHLTGVYGLPAGRFKKGETSIDVAIRELKEEAGLTTYKESLILIPKTYIATIKRKLEITTFSHQNFLCLKYKGKLASSEETTPEFVDINKLDQYNLLPNVKQMVIDGQMLLKSKINNTKVVS